MAPPAAIRKPRRKDSDSSIDLSVGDLDLSSDEEYKAPPKPTVNIKRKGASAALAPR